METIQIPSLEGASSNPNALVSWLEAQPHALLDPLAQAIFTKLLDNATRPRNASGNSCVKLCGFVQQSTRSNEPALRTWAFSKETATKLFNFYIEWNEKDQHRSMKLVLDLVALFIRQNPNAGAGEAFKASVLESLVSIVSRQSTRPLVKSSMSSLHHLLSKSVITLEDLDQTYRQVRLDVRNLPTGELWEKFTSETFSWMNLHHVAPVAGKLLVCLFSRLRNAYSSNEKELDFIFTADTLREWLQQAVRDDQEILECAKNYIFTPLFKSDRALSLEVLSSLNKVSSTPKKSDNVLDSMALLHLAALEVGKKAALVEEPSLMGKAPPSNVIVLKEDVLETYLRHPSPNVRSLAMSFLIASSSTTRPYSQAALDLLRLYLSPCHTDPDAKFRNEILGHSKNMAIRVKGAISILQKDIAQRENANEQPDPEAVNEKADKIHKRVGKTAGEISGADLTWLQNTLKYHEDFFAWYLQFLRSELVSTASYQRHITSLKALTAVLKYAKDAVGSYDCLDLGTATSIYGDYAWIRSILDLIMDPFDDVRESAVSVLMLFPPEVAKTQIQLGGDLPPASLLEILREFCSRANHLASRTARADHADGAARSYGLLCSWLGIQDQRVTLLSNTLGNLEAKLSTAESDLGHAALENPVHGDFATLRYIWDVLAKSRYEGEDLTTLVDVQPRIVSACRRIWKAVSYVLCDDSPEGHLPQEMEEVEGLDTKDLLSYSFRAIYESSNLMRTVVATLRSSRTAGMLLPSRQVFEDVGNLTFEQLSTLRHRGAFSMVSLTFTTCCQLEKDSQGPTQGQPLEGSLLETWYKGTLTCIHEQVSTTRRSAGIPALMCGILAANSEKPSFTEVIKQLQDIASRPARVSETDGSNLPQVHALNCIKDVFKSSLLSKRAEMYLPACLQLATSSLKSELWAIRNCGLLLLRSLIDCLFGTNESKTSMDAGWDGKTLRVSYSKYPTLPGILINLLQSGQDGMRAGIQNSTAESVFPALDIIRRAGPPDDHRDELYHLIAGYLGSHLWHVREIAARTLCSFLLHREWVPSTEKLLHNALGSTNRLHGTLLTIKFCLERVSEVTPGRLQDDVRELARVLAGYRSEADLRAPELRAAYTEIVSLAWSLSPASVEYLDIEEQDMYSTREPSTALLHARLAIWTVHRHARASDTNALKDAIIAALAKDTDTACDMLRAVPQIWQTQQESRLCELYLDINNSTVVPEARGIALNNLADLMDEMLTDGRLDDLPPEEDLANLNKALSVGDINPDLSHAIIRVSGPVMATRALRGSSHIERQLREWGKAMADAGNENNTFDMRFAAVSAIKSFASALGKQCAQPAYLPFLLALYDTLNDDDEDIREISSVATASILGQALVPVVAAHSLLTWLGEHFGHLEGFRSHVTSRMIGYNTITADLSNQSSQWPSPGEQFQQVLQFNDSLFVIEEQNLYIDEVRETERWTKLFESLSFEEDEASLNQLATWTHQGMDKLEALATQEDGPLGWTSKPSTFALCTTVIQAAVVLARTSRDPSFTGRLANLHKTGQNSRLHGILISMAEIP